MLRALFFWGQNFIGKRVRKGFVMANLNNSLQAIMQLSGAVAVAVVDIDSGMSLGTAGGGTLNLDVAAAGNSEVVKAKLNTMRDLGIEGEIDDILITLSTQYHIIRPIKGKGGAGLFLYVALERQKANLAMARHKISEVEKTINVA
jgi:hypothetical protein